MFFAHVISVPLISTTCLKYGVRVSHNEALDAAQRSATYKRIEMNEDKIVAEIDPAFYIDKDAITPDQAVIEEHTKKLKGIFPGIFNQK
jgi:hypothetical protein